MVIPQGGCALDSCETHLKYLGDTLYLMISTYCPLHMQFQEP